MERDGLLQDGTCPENLAARKSKAGDYIASIIFKDRAVDPGKDFVPDELLVNVIASKPYKPESIFLYHEFPLNSPSLNDFRRFVTIHQAEEYHIRFSDFNALCYLPRVVGLDVSTF